MRSTVEHEHDYEPYETNAAHTYMPLPSPVDAETAAAGRQTHRRLLIGYLLATRLGLTLAEAAEVAGVSEAVLQGYIAGMQR